MNGLDNEQRLGEPLTEHSDERERSLCGKSRRLHEPRVDGDDDARVLLGGEQLDDVVDAYDAQRLETNPISADRQRHTDKYGVSKNCTWSENVARQLSVSERPGFRDFLEKNGFDLA